MKTVFLRALEASDKAAAIATAISDTSNENRFHVDPSEFSTIPGSPFSYWVSESLRRMFQEHPPFESHGRTARQGLATADDFRFLRAWWEVNLKNAGRWLPFAKGGSFSPFYADVFLVVNWESEGAEIVNYSKPGQSRPASRPQNIGYFGRGGITWPRRTNGLSLRVLPRGCVFADKGPAAFVDGDNPQELLAVGGVLNSRPFALLVSLQLARTELAQSFEVGLIQQTPLPDMKMSEVEKLASLAKQAWLLKRDADTRVETSHAFSLPALLQVDGFGLASRADAWVTRNRSINDQISSLQAAIDAASFDLYGLANFEMSGHGNSTSESELSLDEAPRDEEASDDLDEHEIAETVDNYVGKLVLSAELASWVMGAAFGRFDLRVANGVLNVEPPSDPFEPLPLCSPGMLQGSPGLRLQGSPGAYPASVAQNGIIVDDLGHPGDLGKYIQSVLEVVFGSGAERWLKELAETLSPAEGDLRRWFADEFFDFHLRRYTKSKRRAPIYWQVAVPSGRYSIWLYAPGVTRDTFFRLQQDVMSPKVAHEERKLASMSQDGTPSSQLQRELEEQENFVFELRQLADEIQRVAPLWSPDLDDGIVIAMSPLWRLVPRHKAWQKELRSKWQDLQSGKYDWAHLAMHLWPERVVPKCAEDRSLAIAHDLENEFWFEDEGGKWKPRKTPLRAVDELIVERTSAAVKAALKNLLEAPDPLPPNKRTRKSKAA